jgi:hypothetical protein
VTCRIVPVVPEVSVILLADFVDCRQLYCLCFLLAQNNHSPFETLVIENLVDLERSPEVFFYPLFAIDVVVDHC